MCPKCSEDQQLEAGGQHPFNRGESPPPLPRGEEGNQGRPGITTCKGNVGVYMMLLRFTFDCTAPQSPQIRPILMGYLGFQSYFSKSVFRFYLQCHDFPLQCLDFTNRLLQREHPLVEMSSRSKCLSPLTCSSVWSDC